MKLIPSKGLNTRNPKLITIAQVEEFYEQIKKDNENTTGTIPDDDATYLDADAYLRMLNTPQDDAETEIPPPLPMPRFQAPNLPISDSNSNKDDITLTEQDLWAALQKQQDRNHTATTDETMYHKVFAHEQGYWNASPVFRASLSDPSQQPQATIYRRSHEYRQRQSRALSELDRELDQFLNKSWTKVEDPDTGDIFYWNEETEEMKWEL